MKKRMDNLFSSIFHKRTFSLIGIFLFSLFFIPFINAFAGGDGTELNPYQISNCTELQNMQNFLSSSFILNNNIDCSDTINWNDGIGFIPLGYNSTDAFIGTFDGNGYNITNLFLNYNMYEHDEEPFRQYYGLFGYVGETAIIENVNLIDIDFLACDEIMLYIGGFVGSNYGIINNVSVTGVIQGCDYGYGFGGFAGYNNGNISYSNTNIYTEFGSSINVGGFAGVNSGTLNNSYALGNVIGYEKVGGLIGYNDGLLILNSYANGDVFGSVNVGGLVGFNAGTLNNSYATGYVIGDEYIGGLIGHIEEGTITNSYATGNVFGIYSVGGFTGKNNNGLILNSYSIGYVELDEASAYYGGFTGINLGGTITNSYYDINTSNQNDTGKGEPKTTIEMMDINTFSTWDISLIENYDNEIWFINNTYDYPKLFYQYIEPGCEINEDCDEGYICTEGFCVLDYPILNDVFVNKSWEGTENNTLIETGKIYGYNAFSTITEGINAVNNFGYVWVRAGNYTEAIYINKDISLIGDNRDTTFILAPDIIPSRSYTSYRPIIAINTSEVLITGFTIDGLKKENTINSIVGVHFWKSSGDLSWNKITRIRDEPFGSGNGIAILINHEWDTTYCHSVDIFQNIIEDYQKSGIVINEPCANAHIFNNVIIGYGETGVIAQNGIQIGYGLGIASTTIIENNSISQNIYTGEGWVGTGILIVGVNNVTIRHNYIFDNENGIDLAKDLYYGSGSSLNIKLLNNTLIDNCKAIKIRPESNTSYIINNSISQDVSETCFMIDTYIETEAEENYWGEEYPNWTEIFNGTILYNPYYSEPEMNYLSYECEINEDCEEGEFCNLEGICEIIPTSNSNLIAIVGGAILVILILFSLLTSVLGKFKK